MRVRRLVENMSRVDLAPIEEATAFQEVMEAERWSARQLADALGVSQNRVWKRWPCSKRRPKRRALVESGQLSPSAAGEVGKLEGTAREKVALARRAKAEGLTRDEVAAEVRAAKAPSKAVDPLTPRVSTDRTSPMGQAPSSRSIHPSEREPSAPRPAFDLDEIFPPTFPPHPPGPPPRRRRSRARPSSRSRPRNETPTADGGLVVRRTYSDGVIITVELPPPTTLSRTVVGIAGKFYEDEGRERRGGRP